jgi:predicted NBD/HSP70 family sugar kinase
MKRAALYRRQVVTLTRTHGQASRPFMAQELGISMPTVTNVTRDLLADGIFVEEGYSQSRGGRRAALLQLNPNYAQAVGVEISLSGLTTVLVDVTGNMIARRRDSNHRVSDPQATLDAVGVLVEGLLETNRVPSLRGMGVGVAGLVSRETGVSIEFPHCDAWTNVAVREVLQERFDLPVFVDNDVQAATLAEHRYGVARGLDAFLYLHVGNGIRLGMVIDGRLHQGAHGRAGELGHVVVNEGGPICYCGNYGCLESVASPMAIVSQAREAIEKGVESSVVSKTGGDLSKLSIEMILSAATQNDRLSINLLERAGQQIGRMVANLANLFDPRLLILAGRLVALEGPLFDVIERSFRRLAMPAAGNLTEIKRSAFPESPCPRGAATLVFDEMFESMLPR